MGTILVTGGAGFIGSNFVRHWRSVSPCDRIVVLDALTYAGNLQNLASLIAKEEISFVSGDICDSAMLDELFGRWDFSRVVHFAAESHVDRSIASPDAFIRTNVNGTLSLLQAARSASKRTGALRRFHHISTDEVYGSLEPDDPAFCESTAYDPRSPYAASKAASDHLVRAYGHTYGLPVSISNCSNNYGPYQFPEKLTPLAIVNILEGRVLPIYGDGTNIRDWLYVEDHCAAIAAIVERGRLGETYNIGGVAQVTNVELIGRLCKIIDNLFAEAPSLCSRFRNCPAAQGASAWDLMTFVKDRPGHDKRYAIDAQKISSELGFAPKVELEAGLKKTVNWYIENETWWRSILDGSYVHWIKFHYGDAIERSVSSAPR